MDLARIGFEASTGPLKQAADDVQAFGDKAQKAGQQVEQANASFDKAKSSASGIGESYKQAGAGAEQASTGMKSVTSAVDASGKAVQQAAGFWKNFTQAFGQEFRSALSGSKSSIDGLADSTVKAGSVTQQIEQIVAKTGVSYGQAAQQVQAMVAAQTAARETSIAAAAAGTGLATSIASATSSAERHTIASRALGAEHRATSEATRQLREAVHTLEPALAQAGVQMSSLTQYSGALRAGLPALAAAIAGGVALAVAKASDETDKARQRLEGLAGVRMGSQFADGMKKVSEELGISRTAALPAYEAMEKIRNLNTPPGGIRIITPDTPQLLSASAIATDNFNKSFEALFMQLRLGGASTAEATAAANRFMVDLAKNGKVTSQMLEELGKAGPQALTTLANAFTQGKLNGDQFLEVLKKTPLSMQQILDMLPRIADGSAAAFNELQQHPRTVADAVDRLTDRFKNLWQTIDGGDKTRPGALASLINETTDSVDRINRSLEESKNAAGDWSGGMVGFFKAADQGASESIGSMVTTIKNFNATGSEELRKFNEATIQYLNIREGASALKSGLAEADADIIRFAQSSNAMFASIAQAVSSAAQTVASAIASMFKGGGSAAGGMGGTEGQSMGPGSGFMGFASGGSFVVGGSGGTDSQLIQFMATPGERVTIDTADATGNTPKTLGSLIPSNDNGGPGASSDVISASIADAIKTQTAALKESEANDRSAIVDAVIRSAALIADAVAKMAGTAAVSGGTAGTVGTSTSSTATSGTTSLGSSSSSSGGGGGVSFGNGRGGGGGSPSNNTATTSAPLNSQPMDLGSTVQFGIGKPLEHVNSSLATAEKPQGNSAPATSSKEVFAPNNGPLGPDGMPKTSSFDAMQGSGFGRAWDNFAGATGTLLDETGRPVPFSSYPDQLNTAKWPAGPVGAPLIDESGEPIPFSSYPDQLNNAKWPAGPVMPADPYSKPSWYNPGGLRPLGRPGPQNLKPYDGRYNKPSTPDTGYPGSDPYGLEHASADTGVMNDAGNGNITDAARQQTEAVKQQTEALKKAQSDSGKTVADAVKEQQDATKAIGDKTNTSLDSVEKTARDSVRSLDDVHQATQAGNDATRSGFDETNNSLGDVQQAAAATTEGVGQTTSAVSSGSGSIVQSVASAASEISNAVAGAVSSAAQGGSGSISGGRSSGNSADSGSSGSSSGSFLGNGNFGDSGGGNTFSAEGSTNFVPAGSGSSFGGFGSSGGTDFASAVGAGTYPAMAIGGQFTVKGPGLTDSEKVEFYATPGETVTVTPPGGTPPPNPSMGGAPSRKSGIRAFATGGQFGVGDPTPWHDTLGPGGPSMAGADIVAAHLAANTREQTANLKEKLDQIAAKVIEAINAGANSIRNSVAAALAQMAADARAAAAAQQAAQSQVSQSQAKISGVGSGTAIGPGTASSILQGAHGTVSYIINGVRTESQSYDNKIRYSPFAGMAEGGRIVVPGGPSVSDSVNVAIKAAGGEHIFVVPGDEAKQFEDMKNTIRLTPEPLSKFMPSLQDNIPGGSSGIFSSSAGIGASSLPVVAGGTGPGGRGGRDVNVNFFMQSRHQADDFVRSRAEIQRAMRGAMGR